MVASSDPAPTPASSQRLDHGGSPPTVEVTTTGFARANASLIAEANPLANQGFSYLFRSHKRSTPLWRHSHRLNPFFLVSSGAPLTANVLMPHCPKCSGGFGDSCENCYMESAREPPNGRVMSCQWSGQNTYSFINLRESSLRLLEREMRPDAGCEHASNRPIGNANGKLECPVGTSRS